MKGRFAEAVAAGTPLAYPLPVTPEPVSHCGVCRWIGYCAGLRRDADHLSLVAGMRSDVARRLSEAGIRTFSALATLPSPPPEVPNLSEVVLGDAPAAGAPAAPVARPRRGRATSSCAVEANRGLAALPEPSAGDLFFDMEGDPFAEEDGLEYLFGVWDPSVLTDDGLPTFRTWWGHSRAEEKIAFEGFIDFVMERWRADPAMHVYHYAAYERGRIGMLATRHATREVEVDRILRGELFVDLFAVVRQALRIGVDSYSIKSLEPSYDFMRADAAQGRRLVGGRVRGLHPLGDAPALRSRRSST